MKSGARESPVAVCIPSSLEPPHPNFISGGKIYVPVTIAGRAFGVSDDGLHSRSRRWSRGMRRQSRVTKTSVLNRVSILKRYEPSKGLTAQTRCPLGRSHPASRMISTFKIACITFRSRKDRARRSHLARYHHTIVALRRARGPHRSSDRVPRWC